MLSVQYKQQAQPTTHLKIQILDRLPEPKPEPEPKVYYSKAWPAVCDKQSMPAMVSFFQKHRNWVLALLCDLRLDYDPWAL
jgi:hypothetical protein